MDIEETIIDNIDILSSNMKRTSLSRTEKAVLAKWTFILNENIYYVKTGRMEYGTFSNLEPISEVIATRVGEIIGANVLNTKWNLCNMNKNDEYDDQTIIVSYIKNFLSDGEVYKPIAKYLALNELNNDDLYNILVTKFKEYRSDIDDMIVFDFLINNTDRHLNNFGFICDENENILRFSPLFDNGCSLFNDITIDEKFINKFDIADRKSKVKPFRTNQYKQIKLIDGPLPYMLYPVGEDSKYIPKDKDVYNFIKSRLVQEDNQVIGVIAKDMGLNNYAPIEMIKQTLGMCLNDFLWIVPIENNMDYYTTHMRAVPKMYFQVYG